MEKTPYKVTREHHLDHMVRMVPIIVLGFAIQCYVLYQNPHFIGWTMPALAFGLITMITAFVSYDIKHHVTLMETGIEVNFIIQTHITYEEIVKVETSHEDGTFGTLTIHCVQGKKHKFFFVDNVTKVQEMIMSHKYVEAKAA